MTAGQLRELLAKAARRWSENQASRMSAATAFYAILAFAPLLLFLLAVGSQFVGQGPLRESVLREARIQLGASTSELVSQMLDRSQRPVENAATGIVSIALALLGASGLFEQLNLSIKQIWNVGPRAGNVIKLFLESKLIAVLMVLGFATVIVLWVALDSGVRAVRHATGRGFPIWHEVSFVVSVAFLSAVFALVFRSMPRGMVRWSDVWVPSGITALGFAAFKFLISLYFGMSGFGSVYGSAGSLIVILLWFYYSAQIFFFGVELTYEFAHSHGSRRTDELMG